jgi:hypothetical protein
MGLSYALKRNKKQREQRSTGGSLGHDDKIKNIGGAPPLRAASLV